MMPNLSSNFAKSVLRQDTIETPKYPEITDRLNEFLVTRKPNVEELQL
jgi:hypothetical protein